MTTVSDPTADRTEAHRAAMIDLLDAVLPEGAGRDALKHRSAARQAHAALLTRATFNQNPRDAAWAQRRVEMEISQCQALVVQSGSGLTADKDCRKPHDDDASMRGSIAHAHLRSASDEDGRGTYGGRIRRSDTNGRIPDRGRRHGADQHRWNTWRQDRAADMWHQAGNQSAGMHVASTGCGTGHGRNSVSQNTMPC